MDVSETVAWVQPPEPIRGLDHLGVQAPCGALYGQLLPGITNVTDRARYYTFHPWVVWSFDKRYTDHAIDEFRRVLRRAECLFALIAIRHARQLGDTDEGLHGKALVGRDKLLRIEPAGNIVLDDYATLEGPNRYFKNKLGGLGQYYFGPLRDLRILDHSKDGPGHPPGYDRERGRILAEALASSVPGDAFWEVLEKPTVTWADLDGLASFCPCGLRSNATERELLLDLFLARSGEFRADGGLTRRASLGLLLDLAGREGRDSGRSFEDTFRGASYSGALPNGSPWQVHAGLQRAQRGWATYQRNELLSLALQGLFAAVLRAVERDRDGHILRATDAADVAIDLLGSLSARLALPVTDLVEQTRQTLPALSDWINPAHELQRGWRLQGLRLHYDKLEELAEESIAILTALLARGVEDYPYSDFELDPEYFDPREIHLLSLRQAWRSHWGAMSVGEWVRWLAVQWGVSRHLRVALRKLHGERRDTFRIRPLEGELRVVEVPEPAYTVPRVGRALQILRDLDLIDMPEADNVTLTARGRQELEGYRGS